ncbi:MAG: hypothetical protein CO029_02925 [Candidatus Magasanikbacteria bacterium CG_4_9_14_0_2_um_filter_41_10]|uniref:Glycosyl transferase family 1 domain-containing protein n=1 Tax=Candidatus Magasanikbacteria bacterium CG_4_10_14_0_2_um_filter_41_31 TaxID=1974639 RepID=A0A2M7V546_9BACT|nr:MAG: hypothetical protein AUJ37_01825 [Candidatus Magasanikbacteria bacterium CG1_02_41_34]PIZ93713.1 MAG: hypothetical protein COX83_01085 [Candidatus Magasanikbacteria bacterium CG_4_10_14_0_2_um_filter_41_31]PJC53409.1 MAG: hypothetical protein CO029_02925 [Candidatus Magasanikbacteria bacterium CG_4_9_14_0_2_um_filter_41_10]
MIIGIDVRPLLTTPRTGVGEFTFELLSHLFAEHASHHYILFTNALHESDTLPFSEYEHVTWVHSRIPNKLFHLSISLFGFPKLDRYVANRAGVKKIDVWFSPNLQFTTLSAQTTHILTIHDLSFEHYPSFFSRKGRMWHPAVHPKKQIAAADMILVPSEHTKRDVIESCHKDASQVRVLVPGLCSHISQGESNATFLEIKKKYQLPDTYLLYLGTLEPRKNIGGMLDAYQNSAYLRTKIPFIFAGAPGHKGDTYIKQIAHTHGARYIGYIDEREKQALYMHARAFIYPSMYEGFGFPVLEALACGTPVIASNRTSLSDVGSTGAILVNPLNMHQLQKAMETLVTDDIQHAQLSKEGRAHATTYSWNRAASDLVRIIEHI